MPMNALRSLSATLMLLGAMPTRAQYENPGFLARPLTELGRGTYKGFEGGLYEKGSNTPPPDHAAAGLKAAAEVRPLDAEGRPEAAGKIVLLSIGMSNTTQEFRAFMAWTGDDTRIRDSVVIVDGARGGQDAVEWASPESFNYDIAWRRLRSAGVTESQVQAVWLKEADKRPFLALPSESADAYVLEARLGHIVRALKVRYPNLRQVFLSSRIYGGYADTSLNPEPFAYESGFAVKWLILAQIAQARSGRIQDARAGDLGPAVAPWIGWGPYLWADGTWPRSDGLAWNPGDFGPDGTHPSPSGRRKVSNLLLEFFLKSPFTGWFKTRGAPSNLALQSPS